jgi:fibronectin-binding autotransporter adhesin
MASGSRLSGINLINKGTLTVGGLGFAVTTIEGATTLENAGTLTLADNSTISWDGNTNGKLLNDAGATVNYPGGPQGSEIDVPLRNNGIVSATGGTLALNAAVSQTSTGSFAGTGTIALHSTFSPSGTGVILGDATVSGSVVGPGVVTVPAGSAVVLAPGSRLSGIDLVNKGSVTVGPGFAFTRIEGATTFENAGTLTLADNTSISWDGNKSDKLLNDAGATIGYGGGPQGAFIEVPFNNRGTVSVGGGTLDIVASNTVGGSDTGAYSVAASGTVDFGGGSRVLGIGFSYQGPGRLDVSGSAVVSVPGAVNISNLVLEGSGRLHGPGSVTVPSGGQLALGASGDLSNGLRLVNAGAGTVRLGGGVTIEGGSTLENQGTLTMADGANLFASTSGQLLNDIGATIVYSGGTLGASINLPFDNHGTVTANVASRGGTLDVDAGNTVGGSDTGAYSASANGTIDFNGGSRVLAAGFSYQGPGRLDVSGSAVVSVPGAVNISNLALEGSGRLSGPGSVTVPSGGKLALGAGAFLAGALRLINAGAGTVQIGNEVLIEGGSTLENKGTLTLADGANIAYPFSPGAGQLLNDAGATINYSGGTQGASINVPFDNHGTVSANVATRGGTLAIAAGNTVGGGDTGTYGASANGTIDFAGGERELAGTVVLNGPGAIECGGADVLDLANAHNPILRLQQGIFEITPQATGKLSSLVENSPATLQFDISPATPTTAPARLAVTGEAALGGTFTLEPESGFVPAAGTVFHLIDYGSATGQFLSVVYPVGYLGYVVNVEPKTLTATVGAGL